MSDLKTRIYLVLTAVILLVLFVGSTLVSFQYTESSAWPNWLLNISTEVFGILVTVFVLDRIIAAREDARWRPLQKLLYAQLLDSSSRILEETLEQDGTNIMKCDNESSEYIFGRAAARQTIELSKDLKESLKAQRFGAERPTPDTRSALDDYVRDTTQPDVPDVEFLQEVLQDVSNVLLSPAWAKEPELMKDVNVVRESLVKTIREEASPHKRGVRPAVKHLAQYAYYVQAWLLEGKEPKYDSKTTPNGSKTTRNKYLQALESILTPKRKEGW